ncbi:uncharacterized protein ACA1_033780 [Acanthamoeba castellanii str. Neff]|uniref:B30.2/SPRY domain-containing protein n=1 Tax=Acanthamoeba castellanii (strain ATCC 30010 / Neff) TaxID=1257118 RepID=L8GGX6_ACACF|nr:uncharacterized protein ACA1_033780 [Acanthamoeba castellanii str. Neff]ELR12227.1 hypothetical protein ACA1_033780 [Acanthamoeba castellanii str. Neff]
MNGAASAALLELPQELLCHIFSYVVQPASAAPTRDAAALMVVRDLGAWSLTCTAFHALCSAETKCRYLCLTASPVLFGLGLSPLYSAPQLARSNSDCRWWQLRARLLVARPHRLTGQREFHPTVVRDRAPRRLVREAAQLIREGVCLIKSGDNRRLATQPFVSSSRETLAEAFAEVARATRDQPLASIEEAEEEKRFMASVLFCGVDYFEVVVTANDGPASVSPSAVGVSQAFSSRCLFVGLRSSQTSATFVHNMLPSTRDNRREIKGGEVIGCGVDWECGQVFFVRNPTHEDPNTTDVFVCCFALDRKETYPAVGAGCVSNINFGDEPFVFDVKTFIERKRAGLLATLPHLRPTGNWEATACRPC